MYIIITTMDLMDQIKNITTGISPNSLEDYDGHLVVDDISGNRDILTKMLARMKIKSEQASNGLEAIKMASQKRYQMIWMDIKMPIMNGIDSTKHIREDLQFDGPIYATTAYTDAITQEECIGAGINKIIPKPIGLRLIKDISTELKNSVD